MYNMNGELMKPVAELETVMGTLSVIPWESESFPGFIFRLTLPGGFEYDPAVIEVDQCDPRNPVLRINLWEPGRSVTGDPDRHIDYTINDVIDALTSKKGELK